jgi:PAS domain-containing protein
MMKPYVRIVTSMESTPTGSEEDRERRRTHGRRLTDRQTAVLELVATGLENKEIGHRLGISEQAVKEHVSNLLRLLSAPNRAALADAAATMRFVGTFALDPEWLRFLFQDAPIHVAIVSGAEHRFVAMNDAYRKATGDHDIVGLSYREAFPDRTASLELLDRVYRSGERFGESELPRRFTRVASGIEEDGYVAGILQPLPAADGTTAGIAIFSIDVTDSVRARERVHQLETEQLAILAHLPSGVIVVDLEGVVVSVNNAGSRLLRFSSGATVRPWELLELRDLATGEPVERDARPLVRALRGEAAPEGDYLGIVLATGAQVELRVSAAPLLDEKGAVRGAVAVFTELARPPS